MAEHSTVATSAVRPNEPARQVIATFDNYADAERVVDYLSDQRFEVNRVAIVGRELEYLEQVLGRLNYGGARCAVAGSGALVGRADRVDLRVVQLDRTTDLALVLAGYGLVFGAIVGALFGLLVHALQRGQHDFHSVSGAAAQVLRRRRGVGGWPIVRCNSSPAATERNRRWRQR